MKIGYFRKKIKKWIRNEQIRFKYRTDDFLYDMGYGGFLFRPSDEAIMKYDGVWEEFLENEIKQIKHLMDKYN